MVEYKELERALLARMFRARIIDAATFMTRVQALGYSFDDTILMVKLEESEAAKVTLRLSGWYSVSGIARLDIADNYRSEDVNIEGISYLMFSHSGTRGRYTYLSVYFEFLDSVGNVIQTVNIPFDSYKEVDSTNYCSGSKNVPVPSNALAMRVWFNTKAYGAGNEPFTYTAGSLDGVKV